MPNRLADSASPYLLQHADNPVDWYEWGEEAFAEARRRDVPLLISIGYSACHWCHVMAHESFEDPDIADLMNRGFVNIKVDREERPDVDAVYMEATQAMTGHGGWPMTVFVDHAGTPFFTGTYFPPQDRAGMPGFRTILAAVGEAWAERRSEVDEQGRRVTEAIGRRLPAARDLPDRSILEAAVAAIAGQFDPVHGGFGGAPKFPQQPTLEFLLRVHDRPWGGSAEEMLKRTLAAMAAGGIRDHLGGGFARYSVDDRWLVPHFEKMLYDNAQLARLYLWAGREFGSGPLVQVAVDTLEYMLRDLRHPDGGLFSAEDADSEGEEGRFYVWDLPEFLEVAGDDAALASDYFGVSAEGNFEGSNILHRARGISDVAADHGLEPEEAAEAVRRAGEALLARRAERVRPGLDDKVVAEWNGLAIRALAEAGASLGKPRYLDAARKAARFLLDHLLVEGRLHRSWAKGRLGPEGFLADHAGVAVGLFALYAADGDPNWYTAAMSLVEALEQFQDPEGGYFTTPDDGESLVTRPKDHFDNPSPSGNALAAEALYLAAAYSGESRFWEKAEATLRAGAVVMDRAPTGAGHSLAVLYEILEGPRELAVVGPDAERLARVAWERYRPGLAVATAASPASVPPLLSDRGTEGATLAYVCRRFACAAPVTSVEELRAAL
ncbi:MAG TPA: thioredoxin domain-containing protein [Acidimicrobiia bacterium]|nr:thioredoxin domain-containing protein [Acidimicrobiia bacterium]